MPISALWAQTDVDVCTRDTFCQRLEWECPPGFREFGVIPGNQADIPIPNIGKKVPCANLWAHNAEMGVPVFTFFLIHLDPTLVTVVRLLSYMNTLVSL